MDLRHIEEVVKDSKGGVVEKKEAVEATLSSTENDTKSSLDSARALQLFLDHIPISSISDIIIKNPVPEVEAKTTDNVGHVIRLLYEKNIKRAPVVHEFGDELVKKRISREYIGLMDLDIMILWFLQEYDHSQTCREDDGGNEIETKGFFPLLEHNPPSVQTKVGELAKLFLWDPFFPIHFTDSLLQVLLLLSKHRLQVVPVTENLDSKVIGFVSQSAVIHALLQASGLEWFDSMADKSLSEYRFENEQAVQIYGDQSVVEAIDVLWQNRIGAIAVIEQETEKLIGSVRSSDIFLLLEDDDLYSNRKYMKVKDFIQLDADRGESKATTEELADLPPERTPSLRNNNLPRMISPVTNRKTDTLKKAMKNFADTESNLSFLIDEYDRVQGMITLRDIIVQFAPPCMDSRFDGGGFFESALEQTGYHVSGGTIIPDQKHTS